MKKLVFIAASAISVLALGLTMPALAAPEFDVPPGPPTANGQDFARNHVVPCAQEGMLGRDCNPGVCHQGLANFEGCEDNSECCAE